MDIESPYFDVAFTELNIAIRFALPRALTLGSATRAKELRRQIKACFRRWGSVSISDDGNAVVAIFDRLQIEQARSAVLDADVLLLEFGKERLMPKVVEESLRITSAERRRWTKDGRLPKSGTGVFRKGRVNFQFYLHPANEIARLIDDPSIIAGWREADRKTPE